MKKLFIYYLLFTFVLSIGVVFAHHANEKYCFDCMHKYKIGDKKNNTYEFEFDLQTNELSKTVNEQISDKKTGLVSYLLWENNKSIVDKNRKSKYTRTYTTNSIGNSSITIIRS